MMTEEQIENLVKQIESRLQELGAQHNAELHVEREGTTFEDEWLYVCVEPGKTDIRVSDYAEILSTIEGELRTLGFQNVLLVPARAA